MSLEEAFAKVDKQFGEGSIFRLGDKPREMESISTGSIGLDHAIGIGGVPRGRIIEIFGPESSGKTTVALHIVANAQKAGGGAAYIDAENTLDPKYAEQLGVNVDELAVSQPDSGEQGLEITELLIRSGGLAVCVLDSVAALVPRAEIEGDMGDAHVGLHARLMNQAMRKLTAAVTETNTSLILINQLRMKVGVFFGSPEVTPGGKGIGFACSLRLDVRKIERLKDGADAVGDRTRVKCVKNKVAPPHKQAEFDIVYGEGISRPAELIDLGIQHKLITKAGSWLSYDGTRKQGKAQAVEWLRSEPAIADEIESRIRETL